MEPKRKVIIRDTVIGSSHIEQGDDVWLLDLTPEGRALIEHKNVRFEVPAAILTDTPVPAPMKTLMELDPCFALSSDAFKQIYIDKDRYFRILECEHGQLYLEDTVSGIAWYTRLIFIGNLPRTEEAFVDIWERHHWLSNDQLRLRGIGY
jgi:hypothetical protein